MRLLPLLAVLPALASCTGEQEVGSAKAVAANAREDCFFSSQIDGFMDSGEDKVLVRLGFREGYELALSTGCPNVEFATSIGVVARGSDRVCTGRPAQLLIPRPSGSGPERCLVSGIRRLSDAEFAAAWERPNGD